MMGTWSSVIATNPAGPEAPVRATPLADHFRRAVTAFHAFRMISSCRRPKPSPMPRICSIGAWRSTPTRCSRAPGRRRRSTSATCGKASPSWPSGTPTCCAATVPEPRPCCAPCPPPVPLASRQPRERGAALLVVLEHVETRARRRQQHAVARLRLRARRHHHVGERPVHELHGSMSPNATTILQWRRMGSMRLE